MTTIKLEITTDNPEGVLRAVRDALRGAAKIEGRPSIRKATPMPMRVVDAVGEAIADNVTRVDFERRSGARSARRVG